MKQADNSPMRADSMSGLCDCPCHTGRAVHPIPCSCRPCQFCERPVRPGADREHLESCPKIGGNSQNAG
jgi:hypothetical protein